MKKLKKNKIILALVTILANIIQLVAIAFATFGNPENVAHPYIYNIVMFYVPANLVITFFGLLAKGQGLIPKDGLTRGAGTAVPLTTDILSILLMASVGWGWYAAMQVLQTFLEYSLFNTKGNNSERSTQKPDKRYTYED